MELAEKWFGVRVVMYYGYNTSSSVLYPLQSNGQKQRSQRMSVIVKLQRKLHLVSPSGLYILFLNVH